MPQGADPLEIIRDVDPDFIPADSPPEAANYRHADVQGIACAHCSKFQYTGAVEEKDGIIPTGICEQWEANVRGDFVSDAFSDPNQPLDEEGNEAWDFAEGERTLFEIHLDGTEQREEEGFVIKEVLRTGEWAAMPTKAGVLRKPLHIVRDGKSDKGNGIISLSELKDNFDLKAIPRVQIPLSDDDRDHKNITRVNTGFVEELFIEDKGEGDSRLVAKMKFTEPDVKDKVLRGTFADVSCGIPFEVSSRGKRFGAALEHVAITNRPFIDDLGPFLAASEQVQAEEAAITHFGDVKETEESEEAEVLKTDDAVTPLISYEKQKQEITTALSNQLHLSNAMYRIDDIVGNSAVISNPVAGTTWIAPFATTTSGTNANYTFTLKPVEEWKIEGDEEKNEPPAEKSGSSRSSVTELEQARRFREVRLTNANPRDKEGNMPLTREELDQLEMSDDARATLQDILDDNVRLTAQNREREAETRIDELKELGLNERPGALKLYRQVMLSDDGGPAVILLSDNGQEKERLTALEILDRFLEAVKGSDEKINLSDQALVSGNDEKPPADAEDEVKPVDERLAETKAALGLK